jgi:hypothetical protein
MSLCKYKDIFGKPNEGYRKVYRVLNISLVDLIPTIILGLLFASLFKISKINGVILALGLGIIFHRLFCVETTIDKLLFENKVNKT